MFIFVHPLYFLGKKRSNKIDKHLTFLYFTTLCHVRNARVATTTLKPWGLVSAIDGTSEIVVTTFKVRLEPWERLSNFLANVGMPHRTIALVIFCRIFFFSNVILTIILQPCVTSKKNLHHPLSGWCLSQLPRGSVKPPNQSNLVTAPTKPSHLIVATTR